MNPYYDRKTQSQRIRKINQLRLYYFLIGILKNPWKMIPIVFFVFFFVWIWNCSQAFLSQLDNVFLHTLFMYGLPVSTILLFFSLFVVLLLLISYPPHARRYESALMQIDLAPTNGAPPALIAQMRIKNTKVTRLVFYSLGVSLKEWVTRQEEIEDAFNVHYVDAPQYGGRKGNNRNLIVLTVAPGVISSCKEVLYDDEL